MTKKIELHDSRISGCTLENGVFCIKFSSLVVLNVTDIFGYNFDSTEYHSGEFIIENASGDLELPQGSISDGLLHYADIVYQLLPLSLSLVGDLLLELEIEHKTFRILGKSFRVSTQKKQS